MSNIEMELIDKGVDEIIKKVEAHAKITAIRFKEWQDENLEEKKWENYDGHDRWINPHTREVKSTEDLYILFKSQQ